MDERRIDGTLVVWEKFECDAGCRWTQVVGFTATAVDGDRYNGVGCKEGHHIHKRGETSDRNEAVAWHHNAHEEIES